MDQSARVRGRRGRSGYSGEWALQGQGSGGVGSLPWPIAGALRRAAGRLYCLEVVSSGEIAMTSTAAWLGPTVTGGTAGKTKPGLVTVSV